MRENPQIIAEGITSKHHQAWLELREI